MYGCYWLKNNEKRKKKEKGKDSRSDIELNQTTSKQNDL